jgi:hypothetical protein
MFPYWIVSEDMGKGFYFGQGILLGKWGGKGDNPFL